MKSEIDQRSKEELIFRCDCGNDHFISFSFYLNDDKLGDNVEKQKKKNGW
jgi:hypothetical protein